MSNHTRSVFLEKQQGKQSDQKVTRLQLRREPLSWFFRRSDQNSSSKHHTVNLAATSCSNEANVLMWNSCTVAFISFICNIIELWKLWNNIVDTEIIETNTDQRLSRNANLGELCSVRWNIQIGGIRAWNAVVPHLHFGHLRQTGNCKTAALARRLNGKRTKN